MHEAIVVVSGEAESVGNAKTEQLLGPVIVGHIRIQVTCAEHVQQQEGHKKRVAQAADRKPVLNNGETRDDGDGWHMLQPEILRVRQIDAANGPKNDEY